MANHIIVDGHNFIFQTGGSHARQDRENLIFQLAEYRRQKDVEISVVFDNKTQESNSAEKSNIRGIKVIYAPANVEADEIINGLVEKETNKKRIIVVTTDNAHIGRCCKRMGAKVITPYELENLLNKNEGRSKKAEVSEGEDKPASATTAEVEYYLRKFNKQ